MSEEGTYEGTYEGIHNRYVDEEGIEWVKSRCFFCSINCAILVGTRDGKIVGMLDDVAYQSNTQEFWNSCIKICDKDDYRIFGSFFDGKGQPPQISAVSHGSSTSRFKDVNVINTGRSI